MLVFGARLVQAPNPLESKFVVVDESQVPQKEVEKTGPITERTHITKDEFYTNELQDCGMNLKYWFLSYSLLFLVRYMISVKYLSFALNLPMRPPERETK